MWKFNPKRLFSALLTVAVAAATVLFLIFPARYAASVKTGVMLWANNVLPATFPFFFLTAILTRRTIFGKVTGALSPATEKLFAISGPGACAGMISMISGYPVGARTLLDFHRAGAIGREETLRVAAIASTSGPAFLVGAVGVGMFSSPAAGWVLYLSHIAGILVVCFLLRFPVKRKIPTGRAPEIAPIGLSELLSSSVLSILCVGGAIALFYAFGEMISDLCTLLAVPEQLEILLRGGLEMTTGCHLLRGTPLPYNLAGCEFFVTFGGLCVLVQQLAFLIPCGVSVPKFLAIKFIQGLVSAAICYGAAFLL